MSLIAEISEAAFATEVLQAGQPVLVDFHAQWCGPCKAMAPALEDVAREYEGLARIVKVDIDAQPGLAQTYSIRGVPTLLLVAGGEVKERYTGGLGRGKLSEILERHLEPGQ
ncbi:thioredoxin [Niveispirillum sp. BGYR6]|uniref:thioredoxin n=1 Tax=Niveispirillum sp. BGYR6 TaxID=2971249 RepID=UPI0022B9B599|nr:thioredoxin [Niveispirillum sp. BGYR6]MDG5497530.1 thioredoxin [Niveispirillum sp. BGYR6]